MLTVAEFAAVFQRFADVARMLPFIEARRIWFWEAWAYRRTGWLVRHPNGGFEFSIRPLAVRAGTDPLAKEG